MTEFGYPGSGTPLGLDKKPVFAAISAAHLYDKKRVAASRSQSIDGPWVLAFEEGWDAPTTVEIPRLISLTEHTEQAIRYYSGTTTYRKRVELESVAGQVLLDLGQVHDMAEVWCNGRKLGTRGCPPFTFDLTEAARPGMNDLEVKVTNTWRNRLIYDLRPPRILPRCAADTYRTGRRRAAWWD